MNYFRTAILLIAAKIAFNLIILCTPLKLASTIFIFHQKKTYENLFLITPQQLFSFLIDNYFTV